jgi:predicted phage replisome organizer
MSKKYYWLKLKNDFFERKDIKIIEAMDNGKDYIIFLLKLKLRSLEENGYLRVSETIPYNNKLLSTITNTDIDIVKSAMELFIQFGLIEIMDNDTIYMNCVRDLIGTESGAAKRMERHRAKKLTIEKKVPLIEDYNNDKRYGNNYYIVLKRDNYCCKNCGSEENIVVHHLINYDPNNDECNKLYNLITLCRICHQKLHRTKGFYIDKSILKSIGHSVTCYDKVTDKLLNKNIDINIEKDKDKKLDKKKDIDNIYKERFESVWKLYPRKLGKDKAFNKFKKQIKNDIDYNNLIKAINNYNKYIKDKNIEDSYIKHGSTFFNNDWKDYIDFKWENKNGKDQQSNAESFKESGGEIRKGESEKLSNTSTEITIG